MNILMNGNLILILKKSLIISTGIMYTKLVNVDK